MELKKNPKSDVSRNSSVYFSVGLALMLMLTYFAINYKTYDKADLDLGKVMMQDQMEEEIPITEQLLTPPPPPPPPPAIPEEIEIVEDEKEVEETIIKSTETNQEEKIVKVEQVVVKEVVDDDIEIPFSVIENVPVFPGCEKEKNNDAKRQCMSDKIKIN